MKKIIIALVIILIVGIGIYYGTRNSDTTTQVTDNSVATSTSETSSTGTTTSETNKPETVIGKSVENRDITAYHYGTGSKELLFIGGIHGGYEWNTSLVAYEMMDYLRQNPSVIPANVKVTVIPVLNPDGLQKVVGTTTKFTVADVNTSQTVQVVGRFNARNVDLNRNFDCDWQASAKWQTRTVSGGTAAFSEPESMALKNYVATHPPTAVVAYYSAAGGVYASNCHNGVLEETTNLTKIYADASKYPAHNEFNFYEITGDMVNWFAKNNTPAISVLLTNHTDTEWSKNKAGIDAVLKHYAQ
ncbi:MAG: M14 family metallopeptidase [bacterium]|nr:M14 family metallopeptidase [bacterium]